MSKISRVPFRDVLHAQGFHELLNASLPGVPLLNLQDLVHGYVCGIAVMWVSWR